MLEINNISKSFAGPSGVVRVLSDFSLSVAAGQMVAVMGSSGCGKTTLLLTAGGILRPNKGQVLIDGVDPYSLSADERSVMRGKKIGFVFQQFHLIPYLNVIENILAPAGAVGNENGLDRAMELIEHFKIADRSKHFPQQLSSGEKQRVAFARALFNKPDILLADEPTGNLDEANSRVVYDYITEFASQGGAVLIVSHDSNVSQFCNQTVNINNSN
jgi:putative ABC transport system ATP-binding protein